RDVGPIPLPTPRRPAARQPPSNSFVAPDRSNCIRERMRIVGIDEKRSVADELRDVTDARADEWDAKVQRLQHRHPPALELAWVHDAGGGSVRRCAFAAVDEPKPQDLMANFELYRQP